MGKQLVFAGFLVVFFAYSSIVYTIGTRHSAGQDHFGEQARQGKLLFQQYNCISCHQIYGLGGYMGPDLTNALSNHENGEIIARAYLKAGTQKMPNFNLTDEEIDALIAFLKYMDRSAYYPVKDFEISLSGIVDIKEKK